MIYSVWDQGQGVFVYYDDGRPQNVLNTEAPSHLVSRALGSTVEQAAWPLPADARRVGQGEVPAGRIAASRSGSALGEIPVVTGPVMIALAALGGFLLWRSGRRRRS